MISPNPNLNGPDAIEGARFTATRIRNAQLGLWTRPNWNVIPLPDDPRQRDRMITRELEAEVDRGTRWYTAS